MRIWIRRIIFTLFALVFLFSAIGVLLYANGYRLNIATWWFEKTGVVMVDSLPTGATVSLGTATTGSFWQRSVSPAKPYKTPTRVMYVLSGKYHAVLSKDGFWDFIRDIDVQAGSTSFFTDPVLLKKTDALQVSAIQSIQDVLLLDKTSYLVQTTHDLFIVDRKTNRPNKIYHTESPITHLLLAPSASFALFQTSDLWLRIEISGADHSVSLLKVPKGELLRFGDRDMVYGCGPTGTGSYPNLSRAPLTATPGIIDCAVVDGTMILLTKDGKEVGVQSVSLTKGKNASDTIVHIPTPHAVFGSIIFPYLPIVSDSGTTYLYDTQDTQHHLVELDSMKAVKKYNTNTLFANNDSEIYNYHVNGSDVSQSLLTREGGVIGNVTLIDDMPYVVFTQGSRDLIAMEQTDLNPNRYTLATFDHVTLIRILSDKKTLLIAGTRQGVEGIFELQLLD